MTYSGKKQPVPPGNDILSQSEKSISDFIPNPSPLVENGKVVTYRACVHLSFKYVSH
jgi:5'-3' exonuclease